VKEDLPLRVVSPWKTLSGASMLPLLALPDPCRLALCYTSCVGPRGRLPKVHQKTSRGRLGGEQG
jgi:hypothetical protein